MQTDRDIDMDVVTKKKLCDFLRLCIKHRTMDVGKSGDHAGQDKEELRTARNLLASIQTQCPHPTRVKSASRLMDRCGVCGSLVRERESQNGKKEA